MKVKVIRKFIDVHTQEAHPEGEILTVSKARYAEIQKAGNFVIPADEKPERSNDNGNEIPESDS